MMAKKELQEIPNPTNKIERGFRVSNKKIIPLTVLDVKAK